MYFRTNRILCIKDTYRKKLMFLYHLKKELLINYNNNLFYYNNIILNNSIFFFKKFFLKYMNFLKWIKLFDSILYKERFSTSKFFIKKWKNIIVNQKKYINKTNKNNFVFKMGNIYKYHHNSFKRFTKNNNRINYITLKGIKTFLLYNNKEKNTFLQDPKKRLDLLLPTQSFKLINYYKKKMFSFNLKYEHNNNLNKFYDYLREKNFDKKLFFRKKSFLYQYRILVNDFRRYNESILKKVTFFYCNIKNYDKSLDLTNRFINFISSYKNLLDYKYYSFFPPIFRTSFDSLLKVIDNKFFLKDNYSFIINYFIISKKHLLFLKTFLNEFYYKTNKNLFNNNLYFNNKLFFIKYLISLLYQYFKIFYCKYKNSTLVFKYLNLYLMCIKYYTFIDTYIHINRKFF